MAKKTSQDQSIEDLKEFQTQVLGLLKSYQKNRLVDAESKGYQDQLEKLLKQINTAVSANGPLSKRDAAHMTQQLDLAEKSYAAMKDQHSSDKKFQEQFIKTFGKEPLEGSLTKSIAQTFGKSMSQFSKTFAQATQPIRKNATDTAMFELTGPFGAFVKQAINTDAIKGYLQDRKAAKQQAKEYRKQKYDTTSGNLDASVKGIFAGGAQNVPDTGSYYLHKGERVVAPEQNRDLSEFLAEVRGVGANQHSSTSASGFLKDIDDNVQKANRLLEEELANSYFDPILENDDRLFIIGQKDKFKFNKRLFENLETIELGIFNVGQSLYGMIIRTSLFFKRFLRHPIFYSLDYLFEPVFMGLRSIYREFFGKKKTEEQELKESVDNIYEFLVEQERKSHKSFGQMMLKRFMNSVVGLPFNAMIKLFGGKAFTLHNAQRTQEDIEEHGHARGWRGIAQRLHLMGFDGYISHGKNSREAQENNASYRPAGYLRDLRYAGLHSKNGLFRGGTQKASAGLNILGMLDDQDYKADYERKKSARARDAKGRYTKTTAAEHSSAPYADKFMYAFKKQWTDFGAKHLGKQSFIGRTFTSISKSIGGLFTLLFSGAGKLLSPLTDMLGGIGSKLAAFMAAALGPEGLAVTLAGLGAAWIGGQIYKWAFGTKDGEKPTAQTDTATGLVDRVLGGNKSGDPTRDRMNAKLVDDMRGLQLAQANYTLGPDGKPLNPMGTTVMNDWRYRIKQDQDALAGYKFAPGGTTAPGTVHYAQNKGPYNRTWVGNTAVPTTGEMHKKIGDAANAASKSISDAGHEIKKASEVMAGSAKKMEHHVGKISKASARTVVAQAPTVIHDMQTVATMHGIGFDPQH